MLEIEKIRFRYGKQQIINGLSLVVRPGEVVALLGPNGAGKTTLFRIITGILRPDSGDIRIEGVSLLRLKAHERARQVALVPQNAPIPSGFTVLDMVLMGRNPHLNFMRSEGQHDVGIAERVLEQTDIKHLIHRPASTISGGEQQRVVFATALAQEAPVLLLDEPTSNLDIGQQANTLVLVRDVCRVTKGAVLIAMHDLTLAARYCDRLILLKDGRVWAQGVPKHVLTPENIKQVFGVQTTVLTDPHTGTLMVSLSGAGHESER